MAVPGHGLPLVLTWDFQVLNVREPVTLFLIGCDIISILLVSLLLKAIQFDCEVEHNYEEDDSDSDESTDNCFLGLDSRADTVHLRFLVIASIAIFMLKVRILHGASR